MRRRLGSGAGTDRDGRHPGLQVQARDTGGLAKGRSKIVVLRKPGTFVYRCDFHPFMTAKVVVK